MKCVHVLSIPQNTTQPCLQHGSHLTNLYQEIPRSLISSFIGVYISAKLKDIDQQSKSDGFIYSLANMSLKLKDLDQEV